MPAPTITALPTPPSTSDPTNFATRADAFLAALPDFVTECNALASYLETTGIANAATLGGKTWAEPAAIGATTRNTGAFSLLAVGVATDATIGQDIRPQASLTGVSQIGLRAYPVFSSAATSSGAAMRARVSTDAASFTMANGYALIISDASKGAGSTITNLHGILVEDMIAGTNNYGITSKVSSGTNKWNLYMDGTASNYLAGDLYVGNAGSINSSSLPVKLQVNGINSGAAAGLAAMRWDSNAAASAVVHLSKSASNTIGTHTVVTSGTSLGLIGWHGSDGTGFIRAASIAAEVDGTPGTNDMPGRLVFSTTADGASSPTERMRITNAGNVKIGGTADRGTTEGTNQLVLFNGTAPVGTLTNGVSLYSASGELRVMDAAGNSTLLSPHDHDTNEWIFDSTHTPSGKHLRIRVEKILRAVNDEKGWDFVAEDEAA